MLAIETKSPPASGSAFNNSNGAYVLPSRRAVALPAVLTLILITLFFPIEMSFYILGLRFTAIRLIFLIISPFVMLKFMNKIMSGNYRFVLSDLILVCLAFWMIYAPASIDGLDKALNHAGPEVLELTISYLVVRTLLSGDGQALHFIERLCWVIAIVGLIGLLDPLTSQYITKEIVAQVTGYPKFFSQWDDAYRLGLLRASSTVEHPILLGFVCAAGLLFSAALSIRGRWFLMAICGIAAFFTFSSAPIQSILLGLGLLAYAKFTRGIPLRWTALLMAGALAVASTFAISNSPLGFVISHLIFDPASGYYRYWTWVTVIDHVSNSPWFGLGHEVLPEEINHTIDALWLMTAIHSGWPGTVLTFLFITGASSLSTAGAKANLSDQEERLGTVLGIIVFLTVFITLTVHFWGSAWVLTGLLAGVRAHLGELGRLSSYAPGKWAASQEPQAA